MPVAYQYQAYRGTKKDASRYRAHSKEMCIASCLYNNYIYIDNKRFDHGETFI